MAKTRSLLILSVIALVLTGCASTKAPPAPPTPAVSSGPDENTIQLVEAASSISQSLTDLRAVEVSASPPINDKRLPYPTSSDLDTEIVSVNWSGPIEPLLKRIATMQNYQFRVIGTRPAIPVLVSINAKDTPLGYVLRDVNFQAGNKASLWVYPGIKVIELRYGKA